jgi:peptide/nickel transport system permease protein
MARRDEIERVPAAGQPLPVEMETSASVPVATHQERALTTRQLAWRRFKRHKPAIISAIVLILITVACILVTFNIFGFRISQYTYREQNLSPVLRRHSPSLNHLFGTDQLGRDLFTRVLYGGRISLMVGVTVAASAAVIGAVVGAVAGYYGGTIDNLLMRVTDLFLAIPFLVVLLIGQKFLQKFVPGGSIFHTVTILTLFFWMADARIVRGVYLSLKEKEFVEAARASGASNTRIMFYHMLPNAMGPIIVNATLLVAAAILTESALSFLGFGVQPPTPTWGNLLSNSRNFISTDPYLIWFPGLAILVTVLAVNFLGDGLRDALDPHQKLGTA